METIKIAIDVNVNLSEATQAFVKNLFGGNCACHTAHTVTPDPQPVKPVDPMPVNPAPQPTPQPAAPAAMQPAASPAPGEPAAQAAISVNIEDVRKALAEKVNDHRAAIKQKLNELGAPSVTKLNPSHYEEMLNFLKAL